MSNYMSKIVSYSSLKPQVKEHHLIEYQGEFYTLEAFKKLCQRTKTWEYASGSIRLYDKRDKTLSDPECMDDPTPERTPDPLTNEAPVSNADGDVPDPDIAPPTPPAVPPLDYSTPPPGFTPGPLPILEPVTQSPVADENKVD